MKKADGTKSTGAPKLDAEHWYSGAVTFAALSIVLMGFAAIQMIMSKSISEAKDIAAVFQPFLVAAAALVTFCTIAWRGIISAQQLEAQKQANWSKDGENAAKLLQEGAKLLGEREKPSHVLAGVASLAALLNDQEVRFQIQAMDLLADFYLENNRLFHQKRVLAAVRRALANGVAAGYSSTVHATFESKKDDVKENDSVRWEGVNGFTSQNYRGGKIYPEAYSLILIDGFVIFHNVKFVRCRIIDGNYYDCFFSHCTMISLSADILDESEHFSDNNSVAQIFLKGYTYPHRT